MLSGIAYRQRRLVPRISATGYGYWPTIRETDSRGSGYQYSRGDHTKPVLTLSGAVRWPTPAARDWRDPRASPETMARNARPLNETVYWRTPQARDRTHGGHQTPQKRREAGHSIGLDDQVLGRLSPSWVEWLMGWPIEWTDLAPLATDRCRRWLHLHGRY